MNARKSTAAIVAALMAVAAQACSGDHEDGASSSAATVGYEDSILWQRYLAVRAQTAGALSADGSHDTQAEYSAKCDLATGIQVRGFNCQDGTEVPGQGTTPRGGACNFPNVLNGVCDPGSKFQVLAQTPDAAAVAHCRKNGFPIAGTQFSDIAVIQYNKTNGAVCFYQALGTLEGNNVPPPSAGGSGFWIPPAQVEQIQCTGCHDNGGFIRSKYLAQLTTLPNALPSTAAGFTNLTSPVGYVGADYATNRSWSISTASASNDSGLPCNGCHRLAVNNFSSGLGTGALFANIATAATQSSKNPHSSSSPIWMRPGQITYLPGPEATATRFRNCATGFWAGQSQFFTNGSATSGCSFTPLGVPWTGISPAQATAAFAAGSVL